MSHPWFEDPDWYHALTLAERVATPRTTQQRELIAEVDAERAVRRLQRWRSQSPFADETLFAQRLALDGLTEDELRSLLGEPIAAVHDRCGAPPWLLQLAQAYVPGAVSDPVELPTTQQGQESAQFLIVIEPLIRQGRDRLRAGIAALAAAHAAVPFDPDTIAAALYAQLPAQLIPMISRTLVLELNVARLQGELRGDTAQERFQSFLERLRQHDRALLLLREYAVLARQLVLGINTWVDVSLEYVERLCADWSAIRDTFCSDRDPGMLTQIDGDAGDRHRGGRAVLIATFTSGFKLVYKPRSLAVDLHFQELLAWLNQRGAHPPFRTLHVLDRQHYGWVEYVAADSCASTEEVCRFYERQGAYLALLYGLEATDIHFENLIAAGEHPVLIDLESLFHPRAGGLDLGQSDALAGDTMTRSVLRVGLLPHRIWGNDEAEGVDLSGLGAATGQLSPHAIPYWEGGGTDEMRLARKRMEMRGGQNRPTLNGAEVELLDYAEAIVAGFTAMYRLLLAQRESLLADDGPLARFAHDEVRIIMRPTRAYALLLRESFHPDLLRNALDRDRHIDRLWVGVDQQPYFARLIPAERDDLLRGDIPMFTSRPESRDVWSSTKERIAEFFDEPGVGLVRRRIQRLSEDDLRQQRWFVNASLATLAINLDQEQRPRSPSAASHQPVERERLLEAARAVGDRLAKLALRGTEDASWIGLTLERDSRWTLVPLSEDLYSGLSGVALFLGYLGATVAEPSYTTLAQAALTSLRRQIERDQSAIRLIGGFTGWGGIIYTLTHLGALWSQPDLLHEAEVLVGEVARRLDRDSHFDIISGAAGAILALLGLYHCTGAPSALAVAVQCGDHVLAAALPMKHGSGWLVPTATQPMAGFAHGAAGMALALHQLALASSNERFRRAALDALAYERSLFVPEHGNWPDLRFTQASDRIGASDTRFTVAWCHGAPGIGLSRLHLLPHLDDPALRGEIEAALHTTREHGFGLNHSLCHGDLGNLELLLEAGENLPDPRWRIETQRFASMIVESIETNGWRSGLPLGVESPGLMTGLAGIGYGLLRLAAPNRVPAVLVLAPPVTRDTETGRVRSEMAISQG
ncbi:MAG TPA: type 2 lanthipeptide synthetase LanM family protein [Herpetosiphonaceae bacterium]